MASNYVTQSGNRVIIPGTYVETSVVNGVGGVATIGVVTLVGEAESGPHWSEESDLSLNSFAPDALASVVAKYGSGKLVDAFRAVISGNGDSRLSGSVSSVILVKTNQSAKAQGSVIRSGVAGSYATLRAKLAGKAGNLISWKNLTSAAEVAPVISAIGIYPSATVSSAPAWRVNGGAAVAGSIPVIGSSLPTSLTAMIDVAPSQLLVTGGDARAAIPSGSGTLATAVSSGQLTVSLSTGAWLNTPVTGDIAVIHNASTIAGTSNIGSYRVVSATSNAVVLSPVNVAGPLDGTVVGAAQGSGATKAFEIYKPMQAQAAAGADRGILASATDKVVLSAISASSIRVQYTDSSNVAKLFAATPQVGEKVYVAADVGALLAGWYSISAVSNIIQGDMTLARLSNGVLSGSPAAVAVGSVAAIKAFRDDIDGIGKALEWVADSNSAVVIKENVAAGAHPSLGALVVSSAERAVSTKTSKPASPTPIAESFSAGGDIALQIGYKGATCSMVISDSMLTTTASNAADSLSINLADHATLSNLVDFINSKQNYSAALGKLSLQSLSPVQLDNVSASIASSGAALKPGRIKWDAAAWYTAVSQSVLVEIPVFAAAGLPENENAFTYLTAGAKGSSSGADFTAAIDACEMVNTNFIVPLVDQDASLDIAAGTTDIASTYTLASVNAYVKSHAIAMSAVKARKNRIAFCSVRDSFANCKLAAQSMAHPRVVMSFQQPKDIGSDGNIAVQPVWYMACKEAGITAVAGFRSIVKKLLNISGIVQPSGFDSRRRSDLEDALLAGLLPVESVPTGGFRTISDQTTYSADNSFAWNSITVGYLSDLMALTMIQNSDNSLVGESVALVSASVARSFFETQLADFKRLNWISASDDAPLGWKNLKISIVGNVLNVSVEVKPSTAILFVVIEMALSEVTQAA